MVERTRKLPGCHGGWRPGVTFSEVTLVRGRVTLRARSIQMSNEASGRPPGEGQSHRLAGFLKEEGTRQLQVPSTGPQPLIGVLEGNGVGPQIVAAAVRILEAVGDALDLRFEVRRGGPIGEAAESRFGQPLPETVVAFCEDIFARGGAILSGPGGGRYVYDLRRHFDLFCKFVPVRPWPELANSGRIPPQHLRDVDLLIVRDNIGGVYQGQSATRDTPAGRAVEHSFGYSESQVKRIAEVAARAAAHRRGKLHVIIKEGGLPAISALWREVSAAVARPRGVEAVPMNVDLAAYELIQHPQRFDVILAPNLFGDVLADVSGVLLGSRGLTFSGNFTADGKGVYQTNHGCAQDLADTDTANPAAQILSLAMLLRESFGLTEAADRIEAALAEAWRQGWRTADIAAPGCHPVGTTEMAEQVARRVLRLAEAGQPA